MKIDVIILGAGIGSRMKSDKAKALHSIGGFAMIDHLIYKAQILKAHNIVSVIGEEMVDLENLISQRSKIAYQKVRDGSASAVLCAKDILKNTTSDITLILYADTPLVDIEKLQDLCQQVYQKVDIGLLAFLETEQNNYGKLVIDDNNYIQKIVEYADEKEEEKTIYLCNSGVMAIKSKYIWDILSKISNKNNKNEYYLTDAISIASSLNLKCGYLLENKNNLAGANSKSELQNLETHFQNLQREKFLNQGVQLIDKNSVYFSLDTIIGNNVIIYPNVFINSGVIIGDNVEIQPFCVLQGATIGKNSKIGPFARLRPQSVLQENTHIGNFVEIKKSIVGENTKINHLSYIGDSNIGNNTNIGAGVITCNYDGKNKHTTTIGNDAFIGSNSSLVAPINIGDNTLIGAGSVITKDVSNNSLGISRSYQKNIENYKKKQ